MLRTLDKYIVEEARGYGRDGRFARIIAGSVAFHVVFYAVVLQSDIWTMKFRTGGDRQEPSLVKVTELAPPADRMPSLRRAPDSAERADVTQLRFDPDRADDVNLIARSPKPTKSRGAPEGLPSAQELERHLRASRQEGKSSGPTRPGSQPPLTQPVQAGPVPQPVPPISTQPPSFIAQAPPPPPAPRSNNATGAGPGQANPQGLSPRGDSSETATIGLQSVQAQYMALVRSKIRAANERIMPRTWIEEVLTRRVSADFDLQLGRGGQFLSARLVRSTGYSRLDDVAKEAIYIASPFEGYPQDAGETINLRVTVYYTPFR